MPAPKLHKDQAKAEKGARIAFDFDKQAWFPVGSGVPEGAVTATLSEAVIYDRLQGMRSRAISYDLEHGESDDATETHHA